MAKGSSRGGIGLIALIALASLGLSGYMFADDRFLGGDNTQEIADLQQEMDDLQQEMDDLQQEMDNRLQLVAFWDNLDEDPGRTSFSHWNLIFDDLELLDSNYVTPGGQTGFKLAVGIYKINLRVMFEGISIDYNYWVSLNRNETTVDKMSWFSTLGRSTVPGYYFAASSIYINNTNSENLYTLEPACSNSLESFAVYSSSQYNQLTIERAM